MAIKDSIGAWKENAHVLRLPKTCSSLKNILGTQWQPFWNSFGINNTTCPIPPV